MKPPPSDHNPHIHGHSPRTRVERLAWEHQHSSSVNVRRAAATILVISDCLHAHHHAVIQCGSFMAEPTRRRVIAHHARNLRRYVYCDHPRPMPEQGNRTFIKSKPHEDSAKAEAVQEGRLLPKERPCFHG